MTNLDTLITDWSLLPAPVRTAALAAQSGNASIVMEVHKLKWFTHYQFRETFSGYVIRTANITPAGVWVGTVWQDAAYTAGTLYSTAIKNAKKAMQAALPNVPLTFTELPSIEFTAIYATDATGKLTAFYIVLVADPLNDDYLIVDMTQA